MRSMGYVSTRVLESLEKWSAVIFLLAGVFLLVGTVVIGLQLLTGDPDLLKNPFELSPYLGFIISYFGLLGLYPRLADRIPLARVSLLLLLVPVIVMLIYIATALVGTELPFGEPVSFGAFILFALGIALFGVGSYQTEVPSRAVGLSLLALSAGWFVLLGAGLIDGFPVWQPVAFGTAAIMTVALLAIGYLLRTGTEPTDQTEPTPDTTAR